MDKDVTLVPPERIERSIRLIHGHKAMLDADLAALYGVGTKQLIQAVKRNIFRFPSDFMFQLRKHWEKKKAWYEKHGFAENLIVTTEEGGFDSQMVLKILKDKFGITE